MGERDTREGGRRPIPSSGPSSALIAAAARAPLSAAAGALAALLWLIGRWSPARLAGAADPDASPLEQPRAVVAVLLALLGVGVGLLRGPPARPAALARPWGWLVAASAAWIAWLLASTLWAPDPVLAGRKALEVAILAVGTAGLAVTVWRGDAEACRAGLLGAALGGLLVLAATSLAAEDSGRAAALGGGPNVFGRNMGVLTILGLRAWRGGRGSAWLLVVGLGAVQVLLSGSRGALASTLVGVLALAALEGRSPTARVAVPGAAALATCGALLIDPQLWDTARALISRRVVDLTLDQGPLGERGMFFESAVELAQGAPLAGVGLAGFSALTGLVYPHNVALELACEAGLVGVALLAAMATAWALLAWRLRPLDGTAVGVWVVLCVSAQVSGDLYDARGLLLWALAALAAGLARAAPGRGPAPPAAGHDAARSPTVAVATA